MDLNTGHLPFILIQVLNNAYDYKKYIQKLFTALLQWCIFFAIHAKQSYETYEPEMSFSQYKVWFCHSLKALQVL